MRRAALIILFALCAVSSFPHSTHAAPAVHSGTHPDLQRGSTGPFVKELQRRLNAWGKTAKLPVNGTFGPGTEAAVKAFQKAKSLPVTGTVGPKTWAALPADPGEGAGGTPSGTPKVVISGIYYDGQEYRTEGDEYATIANTGTAAINLKGWRLNAGDAGQDFYFPSFVLNPGASVRVYTNRDIQGSFSFHIGRAIWNNGGDCGYLYTASGVEQTHRCY